MQSLSSESLVIFKTLFVLTKADKRKNYNDFVHARPLNVAGVMANYDPFRVRQTDSHIQGQV